jgi:hypothetical protein
MLLRHASESILVDRDRAAGQGRCGTPGRGRGGTLGRPGRVTRARPGGQQERAASAEAGLTGDRGKMTAGMEIGRRIDSLAMSKLWSGRSWESPGRLAAAPPGRLMRPAGLVSAGFAGRVQPAGRTAHALSAAVVRSR